MSEKEITISNKERKPAMEGNGAGAGRMAKGGSDLLQQPIKLVDRQEKTLRLAQMAILVAISSLLVFVSFPLLPGAPFLEYDMADVPILYAAFTFGAPAGLLVLTLAAFIQAFLMGHNGWIGFLMHMVSSGMLILVARAICSRPKARRRRMIPALIIGSLCVTAIMIPLNFIFIPMLMMNVPLAESFGLFISGLSGNIDPAAYSEVAVTAYNMVKGMVLAAIVPFNLIKYLLNSLIFYLLYRAVPYLGKGRNRL